MRPKLVLLLALLVGAAARPCAAQFTVSDDELRAILEERMAREPKDVGIVVGVVDAGGRRVFTGGKPDGKKIPTLDGDSGFRIASVTKVFTTTLLAAMVARGDVSLDDPLSKHLPPGVRSPVRNGREITLLDLAMHSSGLPHGMRCLNILCTNLWAPLYGYNFTSGRMYGYLSKYTPSRDIGSHYEYSNFGMALLGALLARRAGADYETVLRTRVLEPLGLHDTALTVNPSMRRRFVRASPRFMGPWGDRAKLAGAGGLISTVHDLLTFTGAYLELQPSPLIASIRFTYAGGRRTYAPDLSVGLGWHIFTRFGGDFVFRDGSLDGQYNSFIGFDPRARRGVVILSNSSHGVSELGLHLLDRRFRSDAPSGPSASTLRGSMRSAASTTTRDR